MASNKINYFIYKIIVGNENYYLTTFPGRIH